MVEMLSERGLVEFCDEARAQGRFALDLEFIPEKTFYPQLALIQVAVEGRQEVVDPLETRDLSPLFDILADPEVVTVVHAGSNDAAIIKHLSKRAPAGIFDTQVAAAFVGMGRQISYARLVEEMLGIRLSKGQKLTDWLQRPLSEKQIRYALDDVRYLLELHDRLTKTLEGAGRLDWVLEELSDYKIFVDYDAPPELAYQRVSGAGGIGAQATCVLRELAAWREREARLRDKPRRTIAPDNVLVELARNAPRTEAQMDRLRGLRGGFRKRSADILDAVKRGLEREGGAAQAARKPRRSSARAEAVADLLSVILRELSRRVDVDISYLGTKSDVLALVTDWLDGAVKKEDHPLLSGWREQVAGGLLRSVLEGKKGLGIGRSTMEVEIIDIDCN